MEYVNKAERFFSENGLPICGHCVKLIPSVSKESYDLVMYDTGKYLVRCVDKHTIDYNEEKGIIFGAHNVYENNNAGYLGFCYIYNLNTDKLYQFAQIYILTNTGLDEPVAVFGNRLTVFDLEKEQWMPKMDVSSKYICKTSPDGVLCLPRLLYLKELKQPQIISKGFKMDNAPKAYSDKYLWGILCAYMHGGIRDESVTQLWSLLELPKKISINGIRELLLKKKNDYVIGRIKSFNDFLDILEEGGISRDKDISSLLLLMVSFAISSFEYGINIGFPTDIFNTLIRRIIRDFQKENGYDKLFFDNSLDIIEKFFEPYIFWNETRIKRFNKNINLPFDRGNNRYLSMVKGNIGRLCYDTDNKKMFAKHSIPISIGDLKSGYRIGIRETKREETGHVLYADIYFDLISKHYVAEKPKMNPLSDEKILEGLKLLNIKEKDMDLSYVFEPFPENTKEKLEDKSVEFVESETSLEKIIRTDSFVYIGYAILDNKRLIIHKTDISEGIEKNGIWITRNVENNNPGYIICFDSHNNRHLIRSKEISVSIINALTKGFGIKNWSWEENI